MSAISSQYFSKLKSFNIKQIRNPWHRASVLCAGGANCEWHCFHRVFNLKYHTLTRMINYVRDLYAILFFLLSVFFFFFSISIFLLLFVKTYLQLDYFHWNFSMDNCYSKRASVTMADNNDNYTSLRIDIATHGCIPTATNNNIKY